MNFEINIMLINGCNCKYAGISLVKDTERYLIVEFDSGRKIQFNNNQICYFEIKEM